MRFRSAANAIIVSDQSIQRKDHGMKLVRMAILMAMMTLLVLGSSSALAGQQGKGATTLNIAACTPLIGGGTVCYSSKGMITEVTTPSGNVNFVTNYRETLQVIDDSGQVTWDQTTKDHFHALTMDGVLQELSSRSRHTITSFGQTFCVQYHIHGANGVDQFVRIDFCD
jgi:hypothetical protein